MQMCDNVTIWIVNPVDDTCCRSSSHRASLNGSGKGHDVREVYSLCDPDDFVSLTREP